MSHSKRVGTHKLHCPDTGPHPNPRDQEAFQHKHHTPEVLQRTHKDTVHQKYQSQNLANFNSFHRISILLSTEIFHWCKQWTETVKRSSKHPKIYIYKSDTFYKHFCKEVSKGHQRTRYTAQSFCNQILKVNQHRQIFITVVPAAITGRAVSGSDSIHLIFTLKSPRTDYIQRDSVILNFNPL